MQKTVFICDKCNTEIGDRKHISVSFGGSSGIAVKNTRWQVVQGLQGKFMHFCNDKCIAAFFKNLLANAK